MKNEHLNPHEEIEVIAKSEKSIFKIVKITRLQFQTMERKPGFSYQSYEKNFSAYKDAVVIEFKEN